MKTATIFLAGLMTGGTIAGAIAYAVSDRKPENIENSPAFQRKALEKILRKMYSPEKALLVSRMKDEEVKNLYHFFFKTIGINKLLAEANKGKIEPPKLEVSEKTEKEIAVMNEGEESGEEETTEPPGETAENTGKRLVSIITLKKLADLNSKYKLFNIPG